MEELNNNLEETMEVTTTPVEVLEEETIETKESNDSKNLAIGAVIVTGLIAGGYGLKKLWDKRKKSKEPTTSRVTVEFEDIEENQPDEE